jgi:hypothetical protein
VETDEPGRRLRDLLSKADPTYWRHRLDPLAMTVTA